MKSSPSISQLGYSISRFFRRFHAIIYSLTVVIGVSIAVFLLNGLLARSTTNPPSSETPSTFDQTTIDRIKNFNTAKTGQDTFSLPPGRVNPFVE